MAANFEQHVHNLIERKIITGAAFSAIDRNGRYLINEAFGKINIGDDAADFRMDTTFWIASSTKLPTSIAAIQLIEAGKISPDKPIYDILPELKDRPIISGFDDDGKPILSPPKKSITLTHLLTHSSGIGYDPLNPILEKYREVMGLGVVDRARALPDLHAGVSLFEAGEGWLYGAGLDWAGLAIERVAGMKLSEYFEQYIFKPLDMKDSTFAPWDRGSDFTSRYHGRVSRDPKTGGLIALEDDSVYPDSPRGFESGGGGLYSTTADYPKILKSILTNDEKLLSKESVQQYLLTGQLEPKARVAMTEMVGGEWGSRAGVTVGSSSDERVCDHGLGSALMLNDIDGVCGAGMMFWCGMPNNSWYIDVKTGVAGFHGTWIHPFGDRLTNELYNEFRRTMLREVTATSTKPTTNGI